MSAPFMVAPARGCVVAAESARLSFEGFEDDMAPPVYPGSRPVAKLTARPGPPALPPIAPTPGTACAGSRQGAVREPAPDAHQEPGRERDGVARARPRGRDRLLDHARDRFRAGGEAAHRPLVGLLDLLQEHGVEGRVRRSARAQAPNALDRRVAEAGLDRAGLDHDDVDAEGPRLEAER